MSWNNIIQSARWDGYNPNINYKKLNISSINTNSLSTNYVKANVIDANELNISTIRADNIFGYNNYLDYIKNINIVTNVITLDEQGLTATPGGLYLNGELVGAPSTISSIADWSKYKAQTDVNMANSTIRNVLGISSIYLSTNLINCDTIRAIGGKIDTLYGLDQINYPYARLEDISGDQIKTSSIYTNDMVSEQIYNQFEISTYSVYADLGSFNTINTSNINTSNINVDTIKSREIFSENILTSTVVATYVGVVPDEFNNNGVIFADSNNTNAFIKFQYETSSLGIACENSIDILGRFSTSIYSLSTIFLTAPNITATCSNFFVEGDLIAPYVSTNLIDSLLINATVMATKALGVETILSNAGHTITSSIQTNAISTGSINVSSIVSSNGVFNNLFTNNISNTSNINTCNLTCFALNATDNGTVANLTANNLTVNGGANYNTYISFATNNSEFFGTQYLYDINSIRNLQAEQLSVVGGWTGNDYPPFRNNSYVTIGENELAPGSVTINGVNISEEPSIALTVDGVTNLLGETNVTGLFTAEGGVNIIGVTSLEGDLNVTGYTTLEGGLDCVGIGTFEGAVNIAGGLAVEGETNLAGAVTCEAGIGIAGAVGITGGNVVFGSGIDTGQTFTTYYETTFNNNIDALDIEINLADSKIFGDSNSYLKIGSISTTNIQASNFSASNINTNSIYVDNIYSLNSVSTIFNNNINMINNDIINIKTAYLSNLHGYPDTDFITSYKNFNLNSNIISNVGNLYVRNIYGTSNLDISGDIVQMDGSINFGTDCNRARNFNCFYNTIFQDDVYVGQESNTAFSFNSFGDVNFGNATHTSKTFTNYYDITSSNISTDFSSLSNIQLTAPNITYAATYNLLQGNVYMDYLNALDNPSIWVKNDLDLSGNALLYVNYINTSNIFTNATNSNSGGYIENGIVFLPFAGDDYFWMLVKPNMATTPVGNEGLQIVKRRTDDGSQEAIGRIYDDTIYTPWANVTGDLQMMSNYSVVDASNVSVTNNNIYRGVVQPIIQCGSDNTGTSGVTITLPVEYANSNYCIQLTYHNNPAGNKPIYHDSVTSSNFFVDGDNNADFDWTTFFIP